MKEYIEKQELLDMETKGTYCNGKLVLYQKEFLENINNLPTVTKEDIVKDFAEKLKCELLTLFHEEKIGDVISDVGFGIEKSIDKIDELLKEMGV